MLFNRKFALTIDEKEMHNYLCTSSKINYLMYLHEVRKKLKVQHRRFDDFDVNRLWSRRKDKKDTRQTESNKFQLFLSFYRIIQYNWINAYFLIFWIIFLRIKEINTENRISVFINFMRLVTKGQMFVIKNLIIRDTRLWQYSN